MIISCHKERTSTTVFHENMKFLYKMTPFYLTQKPTNSIQFKKIKTIQKKKTICNTIRSNQIFYVGVENYYYLFFKYKHFFLFLHLKTSIILQRSTENYSQELYKIMQHVEPLNSLNTNIHLRFN